MEQPMAQAISTSTITRGESQILTLSRQIEALADGIESFDYERTLAEELAAAPLWNALLDQQDKLITRLSDAVMAGGAMTVSEAVALARVVIALSPDDDCAGCEADPERRLIDAIVRFV